MDIPRYDIAYLDEENAPALSDDSFASNARAFLEGLHRFIPALATHAASRSLLTADELLAFNDRVAMRLYGPRVLALFKAKRFEEITEIWERLREQLLRQNGGMSRAIDTNTLALALIRPEARFLSNDIERFLQDKGFEILFDHRLVVEKRQYWAMYNEGFIHSDLMDFPTRTLVYTHGESKVLVMRTAQDDAQANLNETYKGQAGIPSATPTLRGTVILDGFERAKREDRELFYDVVDPFGMYRAITSGMVHSPDPYATREDPILYYAGQGVHLPEPHELPTCLGVLLPREKLNLLAGRERDVA